MPPETVKQLRAKRTAIKASWVQLLRIEPPNTALANPDTLAFLIDGTLDAVFALLLSKQEPIGAPPVCACGRSPYLRFYATGRQCLLEALIDIQHLQTEATPGERTAALRDLDAAVGAVIGDYSDSFGTLCRYRHAMPLRQNMSPLHLSDADEDEPPSAA